MINAILSQGIALFREGIALFRRRIALFSEGNRVVPAGIALFSEGIALLRQGIALFRQRIALFRQRIALFRQGIALFRQRIALFRQRIALFRQGIALFSEGIAFSHPRDQYTQPGTVLARRDVDARLGQRERAQHDLRDVPRSAERRHHDPGLPSCELDAHPLLVGSRETFERDVFLPVARPQLGALSGVVRNRDALQTILHACNERV